MATDDRIARGYLQRALNTVTCTSQQRFEAYTILKRDGLIAALSYVATLRKA